MDHDLRFPTSDALHFAQRHLDGVVVLSVHGEVDLANESSLRAQLRMAIETGAHLIVVDLMDLRYIDSCGIKALLDVHRSFTYDGRSMVLAGAPPMVQRVLDILHLEQVIPVFPRVETAVESLHRNKRGAGR